MEDQTEKYCLRTQFCLSLFDLFVSILREYRCILGNNICPSLLKSLITRSLIHGRNEEKTEAEISLSLFT